MDRSNIKIEPCKVYWGDDTAQVETAAIPNDSAGSMNDKYFFFVLPDGTRHYVWFNINSAGTDPAPGGATGHEVTGATGVTGSTLAAAVAALSISGVTLTSSGNVVTITRSAFGFCTPASIGAGGFTISMVTEGDSADEAGYTDGNIEVTPGEQSETIESHQTGKTKLGKIQTGFDLKIKITFKETSHAQVRKVLTKQGSIYVPNGAGATEVMGFGSSKQFLSNASRQRKLRLHPVVLADSDYSRDVTFWKADAALDNLTFSGDKVFMLPVSFEIYKDTSKPAQVDMMAIGDSSQIA